MCAAVASEEDTAAPPGVRHAGVEGVDGLTLDLDAGGIDIGRQEPADRFVRQQILRGFARHLHEFEANAVADRRQAHDGPARVAEERDVGHVVAGDLRVDDQPAFRESRARHAGPNSGPGRTRPPSQPTT